MLQDIEFYTSKQEEYLRTIDNSVVTFALGPAGVGKTFLAIYYAISQLFDDNSPFRKIILCRPAITACGENLGFLPGDLENKMGHYMAPFFDAFEKLDMGGEINEALKGGLIEIASLGFLRGRTFDDAIVIMDEAQNTSKEQMQMFLTRIGENTKYIVCGDLTQTDVPKNVINGLDDAFNRFASQDGFGCTIFGGSDVVRSDICQKIVDLYNK